MLFNWLTESVIWWKSVTLTLTFEVIKPFLASKINYFLFYDQQFIKNLSTSWKLQWNSITIAIFIYDYRKKKKLCVCISLRRDFSGMLSEILVANNIKKQEDVPGKIFNWVTIHWSRSNWMNILNESWCSRDQGVGMLSFSNSKFL